jgi:hypothetical protein
VNQESEGSSAEKKKRPRTRRTYVHDQCGCGTSVTDDEFRGLINPFQFVLGTYCTGCERMVSLRSVAWENTGETLADYRSRLLSEEPPLWQAWRKGLGTLAGALVGAFLGFIVLNSVVGVVIGLLGGAFLEYFMLTPKVVPLILGTDYSRKQ